MTLSGFSSSFFLRKELSRSFHHRHHTCSQVIQGAHHFQPAALNPRRQDRLKFLEPLNADLHILPNRIFKQVAGFSLTLSDGGLDKFNQPLIAPDSESLASMWFMAALTAPQPL